MAGLDRTAEATWNGDLAKGKGTILLAITKEEGKPLPIRLSLADTGGPAVLKWQLIKR